MKLYPHHLALLPLLLCFSLSQAQNYSLDWSTTNWTNGARSGTFTNVDGSGVDISINIVGGTFLNGYPQVNNTITGGASPAHDSLMLFINESSRGYGLRVDIAFTVAVENVGLNIYDVDIGSRNLLILNHSYQDYVGFYQTPTTLTAGSAAQVISPYEVVGVDQNSDTSARGNVSANFNYNVTTLSFFYGAGYNSQSNPAQQAISLADIQFSVPPQPVPEPGTYAVGLLLCAGVLWSMNRRRKQKKLKSPARPSCGPGRPRPCTCAACGA